jgi:predicted phage terminase large subunit-like protein
MSAICEHLEAVSRGQIRDLVIAVPPGCTKSLLASCFWPAWDWLACDPARRWIAASYGQELSEKNARIAKSLIGSAWFAARWPHLAIDPASEDRIRMFRLRSKGWRFSTSREGAATGQHADVILGDDLAKAQDADGRAALDPVALEAANRFWFGTLQTRRADAATTRRVLIGQRLHHDDTPGRAIEAGYTALVLPMEFDSRRRCSISVTGWTDPRTGDGELLDPSRFPRSVVEADRIALGPQGFAAQNQQDPTPPDGMLFKRVLAHRWTVDPSTKGPPAGRTIITCDATFKDTKGSDFVAIQAWREVRPNFLLLYRRTQRLSASATVRALFEVAALYPGAPIYIEDKANGPAIVDLFRAELPALIPWDPGSASKWSRAEAKAYLFEAGRVLLPPDALAPWAADYATALQRFPLAKHDDDVDATTMALLILDTRAARSYGEAILKIKASMGRRDE